MRGGTMEQVLWQTEFPRLNPPKRGKVRDVYDLGAHLLIVATDRVSAFDVVLPTAIPDKGKVLTQLSLFWFRAMEEIIENHVVEADVEKFPDELREYRDILRGRSMIVKKANVVPVECEAISQAPAGMTTEKRGVYAGLRFRQNWLSRPNFRNPSLPQPRRQRKVMT
jgi:phosphoribosylaminoimidazole-succinocarboxamide synthase